jgi:hypothetical protein
LILTASPATAIPSTRAFAQPRPSLQRLGDRFQIDCTELIEGTADPRLSDGPVWLLAAQLAGVAAARRLARRTRMPRKVQISGVVARRTDV